MAVGGGNFGGGWIDDNPPVEMHAIFLFRVQSPGDGDSYGCEELRLIHPQNIYIYPLQPPV